jgi:hypothetical protein
VSRLVRNLVLAATGAMVLNAMAVPTMAGSQPLRMLVQVDDGCVEVYGRPRQQTVIRLVAENGTVRRRVEGRTNRFGEFVTCGFRGTEGRIQRGDTVRVRSGAVRRQARIPTSTPVIDVESDVVSGRARIGSTLRLAAVDQSGVYEIPVKIGDDGGWAHDFSRQIDLTQRTAIFLSVSRRGITVEGWIQTP